MRYTYDVSFNHSKGDGAMFYTTYRHIVSSKDWHYVVDRIESTSPYKKVQVTSVKKVKQEHV